jgi:HK97 family phage major capsid protein
MHAEMERRLLDGRARETGEFQSWFAEARKRADEAKSATLLAEDAQEWERRQASLDEYDKQIRLVRDGAVGDRQADEMRAQVEQFIRPRGLEGVGDPDWAEQEKRLYDFFTASVDDIRNNNGPNTIELSLRGIAVDRVGGQNVVRETRSLKPLSGGVFPAVESRTGLSDTFAAGGATFGPSFRTVLYQHLVFHSAIRQTRATVLATSGGENLLLPKTTAHPGAGTIVTEGAVIGETDPTFDAATLSAYKYANLVLVSSELEQDTQVDLLGYLARIMGQRLGDGMGADFTTGSGSSKPKGVITAAGTIAQVTGGTPAASGATFAELTQVFDKIIPGYQVNAEWFMGQTAMQKIRALVNSQGTPLFLPSLYGAGPDTLFGKQIILDPNVAAPASNATSIAFGDFSAYFIRDAGALRFERSVDRYFDTDQIGYRVVWRADGNLLDTTGAIAVYKGGTA